jgi:hypothetical protein
MLKLTAALVCGLAACGGGTDSTSDILLTVVGGISQPGFNLTLLEAEALIDGKVVGRDQSAPANLELFPGGQKLVGKGAHTVGFRIVNQTASPTAYDIQAQVNATGPGGSNQDINLGPLTQTLATGDVVTFNFTVSP